MANIFTYKVLAGIIGVVIVGGVGTALYMNNTPVTEESSQITEQTEQADKVSTDTKGDTSQKTIKDFLAITTSQKCTVNHSSGVAVSSGTVYVSGGKIRADFVANTSGQTVGVHFVVNGPDAFTWIDGYPVGFKVPVSMADKPSSQTGGIDINQKLDYSCVPWAVDSSVFVTPTGITFRAIGA